MTALEPAGPRVAESGAELTALAEYFSVRAFAAGAFFCAAASASAIAMLPLRDSATEVPWTTPTVVITALLVLAALVTAWFPSPVYRGLCRRPGLELVAVVVAAALLAYPLRSELWWPACALLMLVAQVAPLSRTWAYCVAVLVTNLLAHAVAGDLAETPAESIIGLWIGFGFWATLAAVLVDRIASHLLRIDVGHADGAASAWTPEAPTKDADDELDLEITEAATDGEPAETVDAQAFANAQPEGAEVAVEAATEIDVDETQTRGDAAAELAPTARPGRIAAAGDDVGGAPTPVSAPADDRTQTLTKRQLEVTVLLADGLRYEEIAACLSISRRQVQRHVAAAVQRLEVHNANELAAVAVSSGLVAERGEPAAPTADR